MTPQQIIIRPILSEKSAELEAEHNQYTFEVHRQANKIEIGKAVEIVFGVRVDKVRTMVMRGDIRRVGRFSGKTRQWKKAMVTLHPGDSIDYYGED
ncbi:50S ribosomal protein L23 [Enhygromyxa salina]|uniref:Large ribosomal subunit protein uL23 n=1 Tax=Enhygromyxa salina TaxID=215803 RepID=A0A2S9XF29_9BACT|nr:50S ribosomal protein L23 [Enhygromyxa salina]PRP91476.1 50S ribosomal protein L23 [Enhygromyxa salina]